MAQTSAKASCRVLIAARSVADVLLNFNDPTVEQALVTPRFRKCVDDHSCGTLEKAALQK